MRELTIELLTVPEVAQHLKLSKSKVYLLCQQGKIPTITIGKSVRVPRRELDEWLRQQIHETVEGRQEARGITGSPTDVVSDGRSRSRG